MKTEPEAAHIAGYERSIDARCRISQMRPSANIHMMEVAISMSGQYTLPARHPKPLYVVGLIAHPIATMPTVYKVAAITASATNPATSFKISVRRPSGCAVNTRPTSEPANTTAPIPLDVYQGLFTMVDTINPPIKRASPT
jgi:hypothetical protein